MTMTSRDTILALIDAMTSRSDKPATELHVRNDKLGRYVVVTVDDLRRVVDELDRPSVRPDPLPEHRGAEASGAPMWVVEVPDIGSARMEDRGKAGLAIVLDYLEGESDTFLCERWGTVAALRHQYGELARQNYALMTIACEATGVSPDAMRETATSRLKELLPND